MPRIAFSNPLLLHGILAISALHLSHFKKGDSRARYLSEAEQHYEAARSIAASLGPDINKSNGPSIYALSGFCIAYTIGVGPKPADFLLFGEHGMAEGLALFRGMKTILESNMWLLQSPELAPMFHISMRHLNQPAGTNEHLDELRELIVETMSGDLDLQVYLTALESLTKSFPPASVPGARSTQSSPQLVLAWLHQLPGVFILLVQPRKPVALVIFAHFCVLMNDLSSLWWY